MKNLTDFITENSKTVDLKKFARELGKISLSNERTDKFGDGFEEAMTKIQNIKF